MSLSLFPILRERTADRSLFFRVCSCYAEPEASSRQRVQDLVVCRNTSPPGDDCRPLPGTPLDLSLLSPFDFMLTHVLPRCSGYLASVGAGVQPSLPRHNPSRSRSFCFGFLPPPSSARSHCCRSLSTTRCPRNCHPHPLPSGGPRRTSLLVVERSRSLALRERAAWTAEGTSASWKCASGGGRRQERQREGEEGPTGRKEGAGGRSAGCRSRSSCGH